MENWTNKARDARKITATEMKCMRKTAGYTWTDFIKKPRYCKGNKYSCRIVQNTGKQKKLDAKCKQNAP
jgi:hypothetical protein